jgi:energy-converting hydrogenase Eha subunit A
MTTIRPNVVKNSAMRFSFTIISIGIFIVLLGIVAHIVYKTMGGAPIEWTEMGVFIGGLAALLTGSGWNKTRQKAIEINETK